VDQDADRDRRAIRASTSCSASQALPVRLGLRRRSSMRFFSSRSGSARRKKEASQIFVCEVTWVEPEETGSPSAPARDNPVDLQPLEAC